IVSANAPGAGTPTGTVTFTEGNTNLGTANLQVFNNQDQATLSLTSLALGSHDIIATYGGDSNFNTSTSSTLTQTVNKAGAATTLSASVNPSVSGQEVTLTAVVSASAPGAGTPTGSVTFNDGNTSLGTGTLQVVGGVD